MNQSMGMADFFSMEAGDYLERLDALVSGAAATPDTREFIRLSRALRGSAIMAGQQTIANVAAGLESLSRGVDEARIGWNEAARQLAIRAVDDMKVLVRAVPSWGNAEDARAQAIVSDLEQAAGRSTGARRVETNELDSGTRAFIAREGAAVGSALDRAARSLALNPGATDPLESVLRAMQPLRGIASLSDLPPLPDLLEGIERAIGEVSKRPTSSPSSAQVFDMAAKAVSRAAQEIATTGKADPESQEGMAFAEALGGLFESETEVVPIESLYHDDNGPHIVAETDEPTTVPLGQLELVSHAEYLRQFADDLERARSNTQRTLRAHALAPTLRALASGAGGGLTAEFARAVKDAVARGAAVQDAARLAHQLRVAGIALSDSGLKDGQAVQSTLQSAIQTLGTLALDEPLEESPAITEQPESPSEAVGYETIAVTAPLATLDEIIEADQAAEEVPTPVPMVAAATAVADTDDDGSLAGGYATLHSLEARLGIEDRPITDLLQEQPASGAPAAPVDPGAARVTTAPNLGTDAQYPFEPAEPYEEATPVLSPGAAAGERADDDPPRDSGADDLIPISQFCYTGTSALRRAISLRHEVRAALEHGGPQRHLAALIEEIFDLVQLGIHRPT